MMGRAGLRRVSDNWRAFVSVRRVYPGQPAWRRARGGPERDPCEQVWRSAHHRCPSHRKALRDLAAASAAHYRVRSSGREPNRVGRADSTRADSRRADSTGVGRARPTNQDGRERYPSPWPRTVNDHAVAHTTPRRRASQTLHFARRKDRGISAGRRPVPPVRFHAAAAFRPRDPDQPGWCQHRREHSAPVRRLQPCQGREAEVNAGGYFSTR